MKLEQIDYSSNLYLLEEITTLRQDIYINSQLPV